MAAMESKGCTKVGIKILYIIQNEPFSVFSGSLKLF